MKYGYHSPDAFTRAFQKLHGITPTEARHDISTLKAYPPMTFQLTIRGGNEMNYRIVEKKAFRIVGIKKSPCRLSRNQSGYRLDVENFKQ